MKKMLILLFTTVVLVGCSDDDFSSEDYEEMEESEDIETLIATNERLVNQIEKYSEKNETLKEEADELKVENDQLKSDILTFKQRAHEVEEEKEFELVLRNQMDEKARQYFLSMHNRDHDQLTEMSAENIEANESREVLLISEDDLESTFHYLNINELDFLQIADSEYDKENERYVALYSIYSLDDGDEQDQDVFDGMIELTFQQVEGEWKVTSIQYRSMT
ncbi:hypothetical protein [Alteribacter populi]|uniref:hypothetical protein n=1 Tax=Alteribacter populi TaxID=2011011 RepID=UPI000BBB58B7|nr:hypothetical protein [Alteribacter populi]